MRRTIQLTLFIAAAVIAAVGVILALPHLPSPSPDPSGSGVVVAGPVEGGTPSPSVLPVGRPTRVVIPAIGVDERLSPVGLEPSGAMAMPDYGSAAWYEEGPRPGEPGAAVVVAHVRGPAGPDVFRDLATLRPGDRVTVVGSHGSATFEVRKVETVPKDALPYDRIWPDTDERLLRLITCGGQPFPEGGFPDNTVVYARLI